MKIYTLEEVAKELKVNPDTARKLARSGRLQGSKIGQHWRFTEQDLISFMTATRYGKENANGDS